jgi:RimJ/RimL family protein N-acetyltransferase
VADADAFFEYQQRPEAQRYNSRTAATIEDARAMVAERTSTPGALIGAIVVDGRVVGDIGGRRYRPGSLGPEPDAWDFRLGYSVHSGMWGRGVASAAVGLFVPALHQQGGIRRIVARVFADNEASIRVLAKNGFELEGTERAAVLGRDGSWLDDCTLAHLS